MTVWNNTKLSEVSIKTDYGYTASASTDMIGPKFLRITDIVPYYVNYETVPYCLIDEKHFKQYKVEKGDLLIARTGATTGYNYLFNEDIDAVFASYLIRFRFDNLKVNPLFMKYVVKSSAYMGYINNSISGAAQPGINAKVLGRFNFKIPDLETQNKIASILSNYDELIEKNNRKIEILQEMAEELYKEWFVRRKNPTWSTLKLKQFGYEIESGCRPKGGIDDSLLSGVPSLGAEVIDKLGVFDYSNTKLVPNDFYNKMKRGTGKDKDILLYKDGAYIGKVTLFMDKFPYEKYAVNEHVFLMRAKNEIYQYFLYFTLNQPQYFTTMQNLNRNAAQPGLTGKDLDIIKISKPDEHTITKFNTAVEPMLHNIFSLAKQNNILKQQRDLLLPRLMSGKLEVKGDLHA